MVPETLDLLIVEKSRSIGDALQLTAKLSLGLTTYHTEDGGEALQLLKDRPDNLPKGFLVDSRLFVGDRDYSLEIFEYLQELKETNNFRYISVSDPERYQREASLQEQTGAQFLIINGIHGPLYNFMSSLAGKKD